MVLVNNGDATVFMSVTNKTPYVILYVIIVPRKGSLHQPSPKMPGVSGLRTSHHTLCIGLPVNHCMLHIHCCSTAAIIPVSTNMWLVLTAGRPPLLGHTGQENKLYPQDLDSIHKQSTPTDLFESSPLQKPSTPIVLFEASI